MPFLILAGQAPVSVLDKESIMSFDPLPVMRPVTKYAARVVDPARIEECLDAAWTAMTSGRPGPAFLEIPVDVLAGGRAATCGDALQGRRGTVPGSWPSSPSGSGILISGALRPLLVAGDDILWSAADDALADAIDYLRIPFVTLRLGRGLVDERHFVLCRGGLPRIQPATPGRDRSRPIWYWSSVTNSRPTSATAASSRTTR